MWLCGKKWTPRRSIEVVWLMFEGKLGLDEVLGAEGVSKASFKKWLGG